MKKVISLMILIIILISCPLIVNGLLNKTEKVFVEMNKQYICIDPGHGGIDGGGMSYSEIYEKDINLKISYYLKNYLENSGYNIILTRYGDYDLASNNTKNRKSEDIKKRVEIINQENILLYISIHCNIYSDNKVHGAQTFYNNKKEENKRLAESIQLMLTNILKNTTRKSKRITNKFLIDNAKNIGCLVETGFLSNSDELNLLSSDDYQELVAYSIYLGIINFLSYNNF